MPTLWVWAMERGDVCAVVSNTSTGVTSGTDIGIRLEKVLRHTSLVKSSLSSVAIEGFSIPKLCLPYRLRRK